MPRSLNHEPLIARRNGSVLAVSSEIGKLAFSPTFRLGSLGSIAMSQREQVAGSPVSESGATIV